MRAYTNNDHKGTRSHIYEGDHFVDTFNSEARCCRQIELHTKQYTVDVLGLGQSDGNIFFI